MLDADRSAPRAASLPDESVPLSIDTRDQGSDVAIAYMRRCCWLLTLVADRLAGCGYEDAHSVVATTRCGSVRWESALSQRSSGVGTIRRLGTAYE